jgi:hypothetical protein
MRLRIESTNQLTTINGAGVRVWKGETDGGIPCLVFVRLLAVDDQADQTAFETELRGALQPAELRPLRDVLRGGA